MEQDGKIYGVCAQPSTTILIWNKDVLRKAGVDSKYIDTAPKTWDEFLQVSKTIKESGTGKYFAGGIYAGANIGGYLRIAPFVQMAGGSFVDASGNPEFSNAGNIKALEMLRELSTYNQFGMLASTQEQTMYNAFNQGKMAYLVEGSWRIKQSKSIGLDVGFGMLPSPTGKETSNTLIGACYYSVPKYATDKEESFKVIASIISKEVQSEIAKYDLRPVVRLDVGNKEEYKTLSPNQSFVFDIFKNSVVSSLPTFNKNSSKIWQSYGEALVKATTTKDNIKDVLNKAQAQAKTVQ
jgi:ABC-type glycerol-3-phosphate transport system substrate-binding protein